MDPGSADLPTAPLAPARVDRTRTGFASLHSDRQGAASGLMVYAVPRAIVPAGTRGTLRRRPPRRHPSAPGARPFRSRGEPIYGKSESSYGSLTNKLDSSAPNFPLKGV